MDWSGANETVDRRRSYPAAPPNAWQVCDPVTLGDMLGGYAGWTLVEFWTPTNLFCRLMAPIRVALPTSHGKRLRLFCCSLEPSGDGGAAFGAIALPALILFHNGRRVRRWLGAIDLSLLRYKLDRVMWDDPLPGGATGLAEGMS